MLSIIAHDSMWNLVPETNYQNDYINTLCLLVFWQAPEHIKAWRKMISTHSMNEGTSLLVIVTSQLYLIHSGRFVLISWWKCYGFTDTRMWTVQNVLVGFRKCRQLNILSTVAATHGIEYTKFVRNFAS